MALIEGYLDELRLVYGRSSNTVDSYYLDLYKATVTLAQRQIALKDASEGDLAEMMRVVSVSLAESSLARMMSALRNFYRWLIDIGEISVSPLANLEIPRVPFRLPEIVSFEEVSRLIGAIDVTTGHGLRDRALIELLYGSGLRVSEAVGLDLEDFFADEGLVRVTGKGQKVRVVPITHYAGEFLDRYVIGGSRAAALGSKRSAAVFISSRGSRISRQAVWQSVRKYATIAQIKVSIHPHTLRHSCATHMVNGGADIRVVQELLGHASLATTQIYTHVTPARLASVYFNSHPRADFDSETFL